MTARAVRRRAFVGGLVAILNPFPDIAVHLVEAECVVRERAHVHRLLPVEAGRARRYR